MNGASQTCGAFSLYLTKNHHMKRKILIRTWFILFTITAIAFNVVAIIMCVNGYINPLACSLGLSLIDFLAIGYWIDLICDVDMF